jgi:hypothetical protein
VFHIIDKDALTDNESMGQAVVDLGNLDPELGFHGVFQLADLVSGNVQFCSPWSNTGLV